GKLAVPQLGQFFKTAKQVDSWVVVRWTAPGIVRLEVGSNEAGTPREDGPRNLAFHLMIPRHARTTTYEVISRRTYAYEPPAVCAQVNAAVEYAFNGEDMPIIEAQQAMMGDTEFWDLKPALLRGDAAAVQARRKLRAMIEAEVARKEA